MSRINQLAYSMIHDCVDAIIAETLTGTIVSWNLAAEKMFGYSEKEALGRSILILVPKELHDEESTILECLSRGQRLQEFHTSRLHKDGRRIPVVFTISPLMDKSGQVIGASTIVRLAINSMRSERELLAMAYHDSLTALSNRAHLLDRLEQAMRRDERSHRFGAIVFIDLDDFKAVNDNAGHLMGDRVLIKCARRLEGVLREYDTIARWGGDEFVILIEDLDEDLEPSIEKAQGIASKILRALRRSYTFDGQTFTCPPSIGIACFRGVTQPILKVIENADRAMYKAKMAGKGCIHIDRDKPQDAVEPSRSVHVAA